MFLFASRFAVSLSHLFHCLTYCLKWYYCTLQASVQTFSAATRAPKRKRIEGQKKFTTQETLSLNVKNGRRSATIYLKTSSSFCCQSSVCS